ncbi:hypothetical protein Ava_D0028 [Trichormus variabilis ATCC 29413]|uniref:Uncharacterized protein n=2 Tax=Anabaena variabilis TaxID=264691 RepID=Q3M2U3_TRIV2|nr:hypothetical protein [Trichormus variabilis]ABA24693.1 hypothetical protein Ava_D0028 [Trichormus variabilis ATCC 29413]MBC1217731.1 hypothetical protein [Trichormus variabilis ARAD]MBC1258978.1 hypothetical protein [Trichormus variabilis V5]MBC1302689.1 hypothetical protein [Trichormus variabilis N2B]MBC1324544.1 hypothetical protein [Trichormus variabilis 9RC]
MVVLECPKILSLDDVAPGVDFFPTKTMCAVCGVSLSTLERYRDDLINLKVPKFDWYFYSTGFERTSAEIIYQYAQLVKIQRKDRAKNSIKQHMEVFWRDKS